MSFDVCTRNRKRNHGWGKPFEYICIMEDGAVLYTIRLHTFNEMNTLKNWYRIQFGTLNTFYSEWISVAEIYSTTRSSLFIITSQVCMCVCVVVFTLDLDTRRLNEKWLHLIWFSFFSFFIFFNSNIRALTFIWNKVYLILMYIKLMLDLFFFILFF